MNRMIGIVLLLVSSTANADWTLVGNGTAFVVHENYALTSAHVIENCDAVTIRYKDRERDVEVSAVDSVNDLGLLLLKEPFEHTAKFRSGKAIRLGDTVVNYGYPLFGQLSDHAKVTTGEINSLAGWNNDSREIQYNAATQPGNSGGPVLDQSGNIVGVVSSRFGKEYDDQTENIIPYVNLAVKSYIAEGFLSSNGVNFERAESERTPKTAYLAKKEAPAFTVSVGCWEGSDATLVKPSETVNYLSDSVYVGQLADQKPNGQGTYSWISGSKYSGEWMDGHMHGQGVYTWFSGEVYVGNWIDSKANGHGTKIHLDGTKYVGEWRDGEKHGQGTWTHPNGEVYVGEFKDEKFDGEGTLTWANGNKYEGSFKNYKRHGQGTFIWTNGQKFIGESKEDKFWNGVQFDQNGEPLGSFSNGIWKRISA